MSWFQLDPEHHAARIQATGTTPVPLPSLASCILRGALGFCAVSIAGFAPWAIFGRPLTRMLGEAGLYGVCAVVFIALAGLLLHPLILGPGSLSRFYKVFTPAFGTYSVLWIAGWMLLRGHPGSVVGLLAGTAAMGWILTRAFDARGALLPVVLSLFITNTAGYFLGGWVESMVMHAPDTGLSRSIQARTAMLLWGVFYGLGLGAGLGHAFHRCQRALRQRLLNVHALSQPLPSPSPSPSPSPASRPD